MLRLLLWILIGLVAAVGVCTWMYQPDPLPAPVAATAAGQPIELDDAAMLARLGEAIRFTTISNEGPDAMDVEVFEGFIEYVERSYAAVMREFEVSRIGSYTLLLTWPGTDPALAPVLLAGHYDVVPVVPGIESAWTYPPFAGTVADGFV